jgi:hypothetical protein
MARRWAEDGDEDGEQKALVDQLFFHSDQGLLAFRSLRGQRDS